MSLSFGGWRSNNTLMERYCYPLVPPAALAYIFYRGFSTFFWPSISKTVLATMSQCSERLVGVAGYVPTFLVRWGIRLQLRHHLNVLKGQNDVEKELADKMAIVQTLSKSPIAVHTAEANTQHYEVPAAFYDLCLGPCKKYSSGYWPDDDDGKKKTSFVESEINMLQMYCDRAGVVDNNMRIVDLGCGWGSLTLYLAERYPTTIITAISNSHSQKEYILRTAKERNLNVNNITVITCNVADDVDGVLQVVKNNDLVMTVEMFEHMKNYDQLLSLVHGFLKPQVGKLFVHIFTHRTYTYHFDQGWMSENFFTGGTMPSDDLLLYFGRHFAVEQHWRVAGHHYEKTANAWLANLDQAWRAGTLAPVLTAAYGTGQEWHWYVNWRLFFLACAELWGLDHGQEWIVSHYLFQVR